MPRKNKTLKINENHPVAIRPFGGCVCVWYETEEGRQLDYVVGPFTSDLGSLEWAARNRAKGRICTIELCLEPLQEIKPDEGGNK